MNLYSTNLLILVNRKTKVSAVSLRAFGGKGSGTIPIFFMLFTGRESSFQSPSVRQTMIDTCPILQGRNKSYLIESLWLLRYILMNDNPCRYYRFFFRLFTMTKPPDTAIFSSTFLRNTTLERYRPCEPSKQNFGIPLCAVDEVRSIPSL